MPNQDAVTWNERYRNDPSGSRTSPRAFLIEHLSLLPHRGLALDAAMGVGNNSAALIDHGLRVIGLDISLFAAKIAKEKYPTLQAAVVDLTQLSLPNEKFDVILNFYYLQRDLWPGYRSALIPGGLLVLETLTEEIQSIHPEIRSEFLLKPGELRGAFGDWEVLAYRQGWIPSEHGHTKPVESIIVRRPTANDRPLLLNGSRKEN